MDTRLLVSIVAGSLLVVVWYFVLSLGFGIAASGREGVAVLWCSGCIPGASLARAIKRNGDCGWGIESVPYGLLGLVIAGAAYGMSMTVGAAAFWAIAFGAFSGAAGCLLSNRSD